MRLALGEVARRPRDILRRSPIGEMFAGFAEGGWVVDIDSSRHRSDDLDHLVVELKAPKVKIGKKDITQVEEYAISLARDPRFRTVDGVKWEPEEGDADAAE